MTTLRSFTRDHRILALWLVVLALAMKALVPGGYMIGSHAKTVTIEICSDANGGHLAKQLDLRSDGKTGQSQDGHGKTEGTCPYSALTLASLAGAGSVLLALALAFIVALGFLPLAPRRIAGTKYLRPPLRGPPAYP